MKCPKCGKEKACILFSSILCVNKACKNFDKRWADENLEKKEGPAIPSFADYLFYVQDSNWTITYTGASETTFSLTFFTGSIDQ